MKTTLKITLLPILFILTGFAQLTYVQVDDTPAAGLEQATKFEYRAVEND